MNAMQILASQPWVERLGMTLLHFLWQGLVIAILYAAARRSLTRTSSPQNQGGALSGSVLPVEPAENW
jgi:hypothetical protein